MMRAKFASEMQNGAIVDNENDELNLLFIRFSAANSAKKERSLSKAFKRMQEEWENEWENLDKSEIWVVWMGKYPGYESFFIYQ